MAKLSEWNRPRWLRPLRHLARDRRGVAAVEFVLLAPLLLMVYFVASEVAMAIETNRKLANVASTVGDLVAQQSTVTAQDIDAIMQVGSVILQPYRRSEATLYITAIEIPAANSDDKASEPKVAWSRKLVDGAGAAHPGDLIVPQHLNIPGTFLLRAEARLDYRPVLAAAADSRFGTGVLGVFDWLSMSESFYFRPRQTASIACSDC